MHRRRGGRRRRRRRPATRDARRRARARRASAGCSGAACATSGSPRAAAGSRACAKAASCATQADLERLGLSRSGTRVTVPLSMRRLPANGRLRSLVAQLVQLRPVLEDPAREVWLELPGEPAHPVTYPSPEPDPDRPTVFDDEVELMSGVRARVLVRRAAEPILVRGDRDARAPGPGVVSTGARRPRRSVWPQRAPSARTAPNAGFARLSDCTPEKISRGQCSSRELDVRFLRIASKTR